MYCSYYTGKTPVYISQGIKRGEVEEEDFRRIREKFGPDLIDKIKFKGSGEACTQKVDPNGKLQRHCQPALFYEVIDKVSCDLQGYCHGSHATIEVTKPGWDREYRIVDSRMFGWQT